MNPALRQILLTPRSNRTATAILGSSYEPVSAGSTVNKTTTWFQMQSLPVESELLWWECYATATGTVKLKVATPVKGGGWTITDIKTLTVAATGVNRFSVSAVIPANSLLGFHTPSSGGATISFSNAGAYASRGGYIAGTGDLSGTTQALTAASNYNAEIQTRAAFSFRRSVVPGQYLIDEDFAGTVAPAYGVNNATNPWSFAAAGKTTSAGTGLANFFDFYPTTNSNDITWRVKFAFTAGTDRLAIYRKPMLGDGGADDGTVIEADLSGNNLIVYQTWNGSTTLPTAYTTHAISGLTLATGVDYWLELKYAAKVITATIRRVSDDVSDSVSVDNGAATLGGLCHGRPGFANLAGSSEVKGAQFYSTQTNPRILVVGDSISGDTAAVTTAQQYVQLVLNRASSSAWWDSDGGTTSLNVLRRLRHDLRLCVPRYVVVLAGANDAATDAGRDAFIGYMQEIYDLCVNAGATPVILMPTTASDATRNARLDVMRAAIIAKGWRVVRSDYATSVNADGTTWDTNKFADGLHPNASGMAAIDTQIVQDWPEIYRA